LQPVNDLLTILWYNGELKQIGYQNMTDPKDPKIPKKELNSIVNQLAESGATIAEGDPKEEKKPKKRKYPGSEFTDLVEFGIGPNNSSLGMSVVKTDTAPGSLSFGNIFINEYKSLSSEYFTARTGVEYNYEVPALKNLSMWAGTNITNTKAEIGDNKELYLPPTKGLKDLENSSSYFQLGYGVGAEYNFGKDSGILDGSKIFASLNMPFNRSEKIEKSSSEFTAKDENGIAKDYTINLTSKFKAPIVPEIGVQVPVWTSDSNYIDTRVSLFASATFLIGGHHNINLETKTNFPLDGITHQSIDNDVLKPTISPFLTAGIKFSFTR
jgi:hypothetical protein